MKGQPDSDIARDGFVDNTLYRELLVVAFVAMLRQLTREEQECVLRAAEQVHGDKGEINART